MSKNTKSNSDVNVASCIIMGLVSFAILVCI